jgi:hypothetical protein
MMQAEDSRQIPHSSHSPKDETKGLSDQGKIVETVKNVGPLAVPSQSGQARPSPGNQSQVLSAKVKTNEDVNAKTEMEKSRFENIVMSELAELNIIDLPTVKQLQIDNSAEFDMQTKTKVKGFCGTSVKTHPYLAKVWS